MNLTFGTLDIKDSKIFINGFGLKVDEAYILSRMLSDFIAKQTPDKYLYHEIEFYISRDSHSGLIYVIISDKKGVAEQVRLMLDDAQLAALSFILERILNFNMELFFKKYGDVATTITSTAREILQESNQTSMPELQPEKFEQPVNTTVINQPSQSPELPFEGNIPQIPNSDTEIMNIVDFVVGLALVDSSQIDENIINRIKQILSDVLNVTNINITETVLRSYIDIMKEVLAKKIEQDLLIFSSIKQYPVVAKLIDMYNATTDDALKTKIYAFLMFLYRLNTYVQVSNVTLIP